MLMLYFWSGLIRIAERTCRMEGMNTFLLPTAGVGGNGIAGSCYLPMPRQLPETKVHTSLLPANTDPPASTDRDSEAATY